MQPRSAETRRSHSVMIGLSLAGESQCELQIQF
jgi:hypothetical protein